MNVPVGAAVGGEVVRAKPLEGRLGMERVSPPAAAGGAHAPAPRSHPWRGPRQAVAVHRPTHRRAARAEDTACSTHCRELWRRAWSSPRAGTACLLREPGNGACRLQQLLWDSPGAGNACLLRASCSAPCRLQRTWSSPQSGTACRLRAPCSEACRRLEPTLSSHCVGTACLHRAHYSAPCRLEQT